MCLLAVAFNYRSDTPLRTDASLVVCSNRDEFYQRPTLPLHWWQDMPVLAGRDQEAGGTWLGLSRDGRFAAVTNFRELSHPGFRDKRPLSRGNLVTNFLCSDLSAQDWAASVRPDLDLYGGFNLLFYDGTELLYLNNYNHQLRSLPPGIYALSNHLLDSPWPKVDYARQELVDVLNHGDHDRSDEQLLTELLGLLSRQKTYEDHLLPDTGVPADWEKLLSSPFIVADDYGTRASTAVVVSTNGATYVAEQTYIEGIAEAEKRFSFSAQPAAS